MHWSVPIVQLNHFLIDLCQSASEPKDALRRCRQSASLHVSVDHLKDPGQAFSL